MGFWHTIPRSAKWDTLEEERHAYLWERALRDSETGIERVNKDYILYGGEEALLLQPRKLVMRIGMDLYEKMLIVTRGQLQNKTDKDW